MALQYRVSFTVRVVELHIFEVGELGLGDESETTAARIIVGRPSFERQNVRFAILHIPES